MTLLEQIETVGAEQNLSAVLNQLQEIKTTFQERTFLDILVLGQFKAGKSSFINSLLQNNFLPTGVLPVTAIITRVSYGKNPNAIIYHFDGSRQTVSLDKLPLFISEKSNPENIKEVSVVDVFIPEMEAFIPIRLVDTPGLGSIFSHNSKVTQSWFGKIKAAIVVISATQPLSESDLELIDKAYHQTPEVAILLSKTDLISSSELSEMSTFIKAQLLKKFNLKPELFPYSINGSAKLYGQQLSKALFLPLASNSAVIQQEVYHHKLNLLGHKTLGYLKINLETLRQNNKERKILLSRIIDESLNKKYILKDLTQIGISYQDTTRPLLQTLFLNKHTEQLTKKLSDDLISSFDLWRGNLSKVTQQYEKWIRETMVKTIKEIEIEEWDKIEEHISEAYNHFNIFLTNFRERLNQNIKKTLNIDMPVGKIGIEASPLQSPPIHISRTFDSHIDMLWFIVPMPLFRKKFRDHFLKEIPFEIEKNSYRLIAQLTNNINKIIDEMQQRSVSYITDELDDLTTALSSHSWDENKIVKIIESIEKELSTNS